jgi:hypothetical protein
VPGGFWRSFFLGARVARPHVGRQTAVAVAPRG